MEDRARVVLVVVALAALQGWISFGQARDLDHPGNYDTADYYVVARNVATGRGATESVLWHYLGPDRPAVHPAGDCWMVGWPLALGGLMAAFGHSPAAAFRICAGLSILLPLLAFRLSWRIRPDWVVATVAGLLVCGQPRLLQSNVTTDVTLSYQLLALLALGSGLGAIRGEGTFPNWTRTGVLLALPMWVRGEGFVVLLTVVLALLAWGSGDFRARLRRVGWLAVGLAIGLLPLYAYQFAAFGRPNPIPRTLTFWVRDPAEIYLLDSDPSFRDWWAQGVGRIASERARCLLGMAYQILIQVPWPLLLLASAGIAAGAVRRQVGARTLTVFLVLSALVPALLVPYFANPDRLVMHAIPVLCVLAASAVGGVEAVSRRWGRRSRGVVLAACGLALASCVLVPARLDSQGHFETGWKAQFRPIPAHLAGAPSRLDPKPDDVALTQDPWQVAATLDVATVVIPYDGPDAFRRAVERYRPRFVLLSEGGSTDVNPRLRPHLGEFRAILGGLDYRLAWKTDDHRWYERPREARP